MPEHPLPESDHVTPRFAESLLIVAVKFCTRLTCTEGADGATLIVIAERIVAVEDADLLASA